MKALRLVVLASLILSSVARANDSAIWGVGGSWQPLRGEHRDVRMESERVSIDVGEDEYVTRAEFVFHNAGPSQMVAMGFPESGGGDNVSEGMGFESFASSVDGVPVQTRRKSLGLRDGDYKALWVKKVWFERGQKRRVLVAYRSRTGRSAGSGLYFLSYHFTGGNWRGDVAQSVLTVNFHAPGRYFYSFHSDSGQESEASPKRGRPQQPTVRRNGPRLQYVWRHWQAQDGFSLSYKRVLPNSFDLNREKRSEPSFTVPGDLGRFPMGRFQGGGCLEKDGTLFIGFNALDSELRQRWGNEIEPWHREQRGQWIGLQAGPCRWAWRFGWPYVAFRNLKTGLRKTLRLRAVPLRFAGSYFVPLQSLLGTLGGSVRIDRSQHRVDWAVPAISTT